MIKQLSVAINTTRYSKAEKIKKLMVTVLQLQQERQGKKSANQQNHTGDCIPVKSKPESYAKQLSLGLEDARVEERNLEKHVEILLNQKKALENKNKRA